MKLKCKKQPLVDALVISSRAVSSKNPVPALEGVLLKAVNNTLFVTGYNLKRGIITNIDADVDSSGSIVLNAKLLLDVSRKMPGNDIEITVDNSFVTTISSERTVLQLLGVTAADYPELPTVNNEKGIKLKDSLLKSLINDTLFAISDNEARPIHTGACFNSSEGMLTVAAVDGYRLAIRKEKVNKKKCPDFKIVVPKFALYDLEKMLTGTEVDVHISHDEKHISFTTENGILISRILDGEFLDYDNAVPQNTKYTLTADKTDIIPAIERVSLVLGDINKQPIKCVFENDILKLSSNSSIGKANDECILTGDAEGLEIGFNNRLILETLKSVPADNITINMNNGTSPFVIKPVDGSDKFTYMVLPVRLKAS